MASLVTKSISVLLPLTILLGTTHAVTVTDVVLKKDHVIDLLFINTIEETRQAQKQYFRDVGPKARPLGYQPIIAFRITRKPISGNYFPDTLAIASWPGNMNDRAKYLETLEQAVPDLHARRFNHWSSFNMTHHYVPRDIPIRFDPAKIYVLSSYWPNNDSSFMAFRKQQKQRIAEHGGVVKLDLDKGHSLFGYLYQPEVTMITEWRNQAAFDAFRQSNPGNDRQALKQHNQLYLELIPPRR